MSIHKIIFESQKDVHIINFKLKKKRECFNPNYDEDIDGGKDVSLDYLHFSP